MAATILKLKSLNSTFEMPAVLSLSLDGIRLIAALLVFLSHLTAREYTTAVPWIAYGDDAVIVFFVISGFLIAHVVWTKERTLSAYASARFARLYSVVLPALALTFVLDLIGRASLPDLYASVPEDRTALRLAINGTFVQQCWNLTVAPLSNGPFWSLSFEFWYYGIFGAWALTTGKRRVMLIAAFSAIAGPRILAFFPLWLAGALAYGALRRWPPKPVQSVTLLLLGLGVTVILLFWGNPGITLAHWLQARHPTRSISVAGISLFLGDIARLPEFMVLASLIAAALYALGGFAARIDMSRVPVRAVRYLSGATFSIYLFHAPIIRVVFSIIDPSRHSQAELVGVGAFSMVLCLALAHISERRLLAWRKLFDHLLLKARKRSRSFDH